ncbi:hypothetical protein [Vineibacter terrae]|uniref:hypothetical protein n=1 Tax=Vineibacter terrae TaxID=2586908 RepID=UPI002E3134F8|nr:hypothetical protein [Vineibacter terrae]HEX2891366.1 hypothetical protein [Vineibacter terrae]
MITLAQPSMALNAENVPGPDYKMWNTWRVPKGDTPSHVIGWTATVAKGASGGKLNALVINCHGRPAHLSLGTGFGWSEVPLFAGLAGLVDDIYIVACKVVSFGGSADGNLFCGAIAKAAKANVYASNASQTTGLWPSIPYGKIDGYEGKVWKWHPDGSNELTDL